MARPERHGRQNGKVTVRYAGKLFHLDIGRAYKHKKILMVITDNHVIKSLAETGEVITEHYIDTARDYQKAYWKHGDPHFTPNEQNRHPRIKTTGMPVRPACRD